MVPSLILAKARSFDRSRQVLWDSGQYQVTRGPSGVGAFPTLSGLGEEVGAYPTLSGLTDDPIGYLQSNWLWLVPTGLVLWWWLK